MGRIVHGAKRPAGEPFRGQNVKAVGETSRGRNVHKSFFLHEFDSRRLRFAVARFRTASGRFQSPDGVRTAPDSVRTSALHGPGGPAARPDRAGPGLATTARTDYT